MDPITTALVAAASAGALGGLANVSKTTITDAYTYLKALLIKKFGNESDVVHALNGVEAKPDSTGRTATLQEEIAAVKADQDQEMLSAAQALLHLLQATPQGIQHIQMATGNTIAQADRGSTASVNIGRQSEY